VPLAALDLRVSELLLAPEKPNSGENERRKGKPYEITVCFNRVPFRIPKSSEKRSAAALPMSANLGGAIVRSKRW
jgi:hypothetical protein